MSATIPHVPDRTSRSLLLGLLVTLLLTPPVAAGEPAERSVSSKVVDKRNQLVLKGNVSPGYAGGTVVVQKKDCRGDRCDWHRYRLVTANDEGGFRSVIDAPRKGYWYWRAKVPASAGYATAYSRVWRTFND